MTEKGKNYEKGFRLSKGPKFYIFSNN